MNLGDNISLESLKNKLDKISEVNLYDGKKEFSFPFI